MPHPTLTKEAADKIAWQAVADAANKYLPTDLFRSGAWAAPPDAGLIRGYLQNRFLEGTRSRILGNPINLANDLAAKGMKGVYKDFFWAPHRDYGQMAKSVAPEFLRRFGGEGVSKAYESTSNFVRGPGNTYLSRAMSVGMPALQWYRAYKSDPTERGSAIGGAVASTLASPITSQLGLPGQFLLHRPIVTAGRAVGSLFNKKAPPGAHPGQAPQPDAYAGQPHPHLQAGGYAAPPPHYQQQPQQQQPGGYPGPHPPPYQQQAGWSPGNAAYPPR